MKHLIVIGIITLSFGTFSQEVAVIDSVDKELIELSSVDEKAKLVAKLIGRSKGKDEALSTYALRKLRDYSLVDSCKNCKTNYTYNKALYFSYKNEKDSALFYYKIAANEADKAGNIATKILTTIKISSILKSQNKNQESTDLLLESIKGFSDSLKSPGLKEFSNQISNQVSEQNTKFLLAQERRKAAKKREELKRERRYWIGGITFLLLSLLGLILYLRFKRKQNQTQQKLLSSQLNTLLAQMNPHFIFNCLNSIKGLVITDNKEKAADYITDFSKMLRHILENSSNMEITLQEEINLLDKYIDVERHRTSSPLLFIKEIDASIDSASTTVFPFLIQPFIENSIKHGFITANTENRIELKVNKLSDEWLHVTIEDNGIGIRSEQRADQNKSKAIDIVKERLKLINKTSDNMTIEYRGDSKGTKVTLKVKHNERG